MEANETFSELKAQMQAAYEFVDVITTPWKLAA